MKERENILFTDMDDKSVEEIADFTEGLDEDTKKRILEECRRKMKDDSKNRVIYTEDNNDDTVEVIRKEENKIHYLKPVLSVAACAAIITGAAFIVSGLKDKTNEIHISPAEPSVSITEETTNNPVTEKSVTEAVTDSTQTVTSETEITSVQTAAESVTVTSVVSETSEEKNETQSLIQYPDDTDELKENYMAVYRSMAAGASKALKMIEGFGIASTDDDDNLFVSLDGKKILFRGTYEDFYDEYSGTPALVACKVNDQEIHNNDEFMDYVFTYFSDGLTNFNRNEKRIFEYDGGYWTIVPQKGFLFSQFSTDDAEISDIVKDDSFVITARNTGFEGNDDSNRYKIKFTLTDEGWRISGIDDLSGYCVLK